ncbi:MAG: hypothetical protein ACM3IJ_02730 [Candidatus Levyibacteriota bacterium]
MNKILFGSYVFMLFLFTLFSYLFIDPNFFYLRPLYSGIAFDHRVLVTLGYAIFICGFFVFYLYFLKAVKKISVLKILLVFSFLLLISYPTILSYDIFNYATTAKVTYFYKENPYLVMPNEFLGDKDVVFTRATNKVALYGPFWIMLSFLPYLLGFGNYLVQAFFFKVLVGTFYFLTVWVIYKLSDKDVGKTAFFALNPLVLIETFVSGHNDVAMVFFALYSLYLFKNGKNLLSGFSLVLSILIKYATLFLLPVWVYLLYFRLKQKKISWEKVYVYSLILMFFVFLLSPLREEMYPWYAIWFIPFVSLLESKRLKALTIAFSFGLMLRYLPYMASGTYFGFVPLVRILLMLVPVILSAVLLLFLQLKARKV